MLFLVLVKHFVSVSLTNLTSSSNFGHYKITYVPVELRLEENHNRMLHLILLYLILKEFNFKFMKLIKCRHQFFF